MGLGLQLMPISIVIPKMKEYPVVDDWIEETKVLFLNRLNDGKSLKPEETKPSWNKWFKNLVLNHFLLHYPLSMDDIEDAQVNVGFDYERGEY